MPTKITVDFLKRRAIRIATPNPNSSDGFYRQGDEDVLAKNAEDGELEGYADRGVLKLTRKTTRKKKDVSTSSDST